MFESVLEQNIPRRRLGRGAILSITVHVVLVALALYISSRPKSGGQEKLRSVTFFNPPPPPPPPPPPAGGGGKPKPRTEQHKVVKKPDTVVQTPKTEKVAEKPPDPSPASASPDPAGQVGGVVGGVAGGQVGGVVGGQLGGVVGGTGNGTQTIPFGYGMQKPSVVEQADIRCSKDAMAMHVTGLALVKCTINLDGSVSDCKINKSLPYMDQEIMKGLKTMRFSPVTYQGHPQKVEMSFPLRVTGCG